MKNQCSFNWLDSIHGKAWGPMKANLRRSTFKGIMQASALCARNADTLSPVKDAMIQKGEQPAQVEGTTTVVDKHPLQPGKSSHSSLTRPISKVSHLRQSISGHAFPSKAAPENPIPALPNNNDNNNSDQSFQDSLRSTQDAPQFETTPFTEQAEKSVLGSGPRSVARISLLNAQPRKRQADDRLFACTTKKSHVAPPNSPMEISPIGPNILHNSETANIARRDRDPLCPRRGTPFQPTVSLAGIDLRMLSVRAGNPSDAQTNTGASIRNQANPFSEMRQADPTRRGKRIRTSKGKGPQIRMNSSGRLFKHQMLRPC